MALLFEPIADHLLAGGEPTLETVGGAVQAGLVTDDLLVETAYHGRNVRFPPVLGVDVPLRPECGFLPGGVTVPPAGADLGRLLGLSAGLAGLGEFPDRLIRLGALPHTAAGVEVEPDSLGLRQRSFGLGHSGGPIWQADAHDGGSSKGCFGVQEGRDARLLVRGERLEVLAGEGAAVRHTGVAGPGWRTGGGPLLAHIVHALG